MADFTKFRSSVGGFNRSDVANYIEALSMGHQQATKKLREENADLSAQLAQLHLQLDEQTAAKEALQEKLTQTETALTSTETALNEAMVMLDELQPAPAPEQTPDYAAMELEAYRRAEAAERLALDRSARMRQKLGDLLAGVTARYEASGQEIQVLSEDLRNNLQRLQETLSDLELVFDDTNAGFEALEDEDLPNG